MIASVPQFSKPRARHSSKELGRRLARRAGLSLLAVTIFVVSAAGFAWHNIQSRIAWFNIDGLLSEEDRPGTKPPDSYEGRAVNLLILGTDSREGKEGKNNIDGSQAIDPSMARPPAEAANGGFRCRDSDLQGRLHINNRQRHLRITLQVSDEFQHCRTGPAS